MLLLEQHDGYGVELWWVALCWEILDSLHHCLCTNIYGYSKYSWTNTAIVPTLWHCLCGSDLAQMVISFRSIGLTTQCIASHKDGLARQFNLEATHGWLLLMSPLSTLLSLMEYSVKNSRVVPTVATCSRFMMIVWGSSWKITWSSHDHHMIITCHSLSESKSPTGKCWSSTKPNSAMLVIVTLSLTL